MTRVAALILPADIHDKRIRALRLDLEGGDKRVFGGHHGMVVFAPELKPNYELHGPPSEDGYESHHLFLSR
jgi:hypothetical protein